MSELAGKPQRRLRVSTKNEDTPKRSTPIIVKLSEVEPEEIAWLWPGRIAIGKLTMISGDPGLGKSFLTCDLAARITTGALWPVDNLQRAPQGCVVMLNCEDELADTIRPRLDAHGADVERVVAIRAIRQSSQPSRERPFDLSRDITALEQTIEQLDDCKLVVIDPITAYLGPHTDSHKNAEVRAVLAPLADLAARRKVAIVAISHLNKGNGPAMYRTMGSLGFVAAMRSAWCVSKDIAQPNRRLLLPLKNNLGSDINGFAFTIDDGRIRWEPKLVTTTADEALAHEKRRRGPLPEDRTAAKELLVSCLENGPRKATEIEDEVVFGHGISKRTLMRARRELGIKAYRPQIPGPWMWSLSDGKTALEPSTHKKPGILGSLAWRSEKMRCRVAPSRKTAK